MKALTKAEPNALIEVGRNIIALEEEHKALQAAIKQQREFILQGMKKNRLKSLKMDDGTTFVIKEGNRKVVIKDEEKAEKYLEEMNCWKIDTTKLLTIFGRELKVPKFFAVERGPESLAIMPPKVRV